MPRNRKSPLTIQQRRDIARIRKIGSGKSATKLDDVTLGALIGFLEQDLAIPGYLSSLPQELRPTKGFFDTNPWLPHLDRGFRFDFEGVYAEALDVMQDFERAFESLAEIQLRRLRIANIRATQPIPDIGSIAYRGLIEDGKLSTDAKATLMRLSKHIYNIDNRVAQEAAYMHVNIVCRALRGAKHSSRTSPIRKSGEGFRRRNVDCIVGRRAYDFKGRLTEAPSRRARFEDELMFPRDCAISGYQPVLLAFECEEGERTESLIEAYQRNGGLALIGNEAWGHLLQEAGPVMSRFLSTYLIAPIEQLNGARSDVMDMTVRVRPEHIDYLFTRPGGEVERIRVQRNLS